MGILDIFKTKNIEINPYDEIVSALKAKIKFYSEDVYNTASYFATDLYEKYSNININNIDDISLDEFLTMLVIKHGSFTEELGRVIQFSSNLPDDVMSILEPESTKLYAGEMADKTIEILKSKNLPLPSFNLKKAVQKQEITFKRIMDLEKELRLEFEKYMFIKSQASLVSNLFDVKIKNSESKRILEREFSDLYDKIRECIECMKTIGDGLNDKKIAKMLTRYKNALTEFEKANNEEDMSKCLSTVSSIDDEDLLKKIYLYMYNHNKPYYERIEKEYEEKSKNSIYAYVELFRKYGLDFSILDDNYKSKIMSDGIDIVKKKLEIISSFADKKDYYALIIGTQVTTLFYIENLINTGVIDTGFVKSNIGVVVNQNLFEEFKKNIEFLMNKINMRKVESKLFLLSRNDIIKTNIILLERYGIEYGKCMDLSFLGEDILDKLSLFVEVGLENEIINNPDILNVDVDLAKRVLLTEMVEGKKINKNSFNELVINPQLFFVSPSKVNRVLERDNTKYNMGGVIDLSKTKSTKLSYIVEGVIIPKTRITTMPPNIEDIVKSSLYSKDQIKVLEKSMTK